MDGTEKLLFSLCGKCGAENLKDFCPHTDEEREMLVTVCTPELYRALELGYQIVEVRNDYFQVLVRFTAFLNSLLVGIC